MATGTVYLDVDDEITSAAARIRGSEATKVALVVPYGSRIATSRMNFRLLSREAVVNNRRLSIVASDAATRALAASAGLPVFASVAEYDAASVPVDGPRDGAPPVAPTSDSDAEGKGGGAAIAATAVGAAALAGAAGTVATPPAAAKRKSKAKAAAGPPPVSDETQKVVAPQMAPTTSLPAPVTAAVAAAAGATAVTHGPSVGPAPSIAPAPTVRVPVLRSRRMPKIGPTAVIIGAAIVLAIVVAGVAAYIFLPSAQIAVTPKEEPIPPISLTVRADPDATAIDAETGVVPAERLEVPVLVSESFETTGRRVEETPANGVVTFESYNFLASNTIPSGSIVSTEGGIQFVTQRAVTLPQADLVLPNVIPSRVNVAVVAAKAGEAGNVPANAIRVVPRGEDPEVTKVNNADATSGGAREEFPQVSEAEVTAALEKLNADLATAFAAAVEDGAGAPENTTVYPETAVMGPSTPTVDPASLVGQEVADFDLGVSADGTVIAVDDSPVKGIAESRLLANVGADYRLVDGSVRITPGEPTVTGGQVSFPVSASASRVRILDAGELLALVKDKSIEEAEAALAPYGQVEITPWPDWVSSIPSLDARVTLVIVGQDGPAGGEGGATPYESAPPGADGSP
jgi:hypothetical protein